MKKYIRTLMLLITVAFFSGCNQEDDILEIFDSGVWNVENYYTSVDWDTNKVKWGKPVYLNKDDLKSISQITIVFDSDGTFTGSLINGGTYSGKWEAHPKDRSFHVIGDIKTSINLSGKNAEYIKTIKNASFYRGDSKTVLRLAPQSRTNCIQFVHIRK